MQPAAAAGALALLLLLAWLAGFFGGGSGDDSQIAGNANIPEGDYFIIDEPVSESVQSQALPSVFTPAPAAAASPVARSKRNSSAKPPENTEEAAPPRWTIPADPLPADPGYQYRADLRIPLQTTMLDNNTVYPSVFADRNGPFALLMPHWTEPPYARASETPGGKRRVFLKENPQQPPPVIDLRTGETVGEFSWKSPFWSNARLSPNGEYLVGPDAAPFWLRGQEWPGIGIAEPNMLFVWKQKADKPLHKLPVEGVVLWAEFVNDNQFAVYLVGEKSTLKVWDVATGKLAATIPLSVAPFQIGTDPKEGQWGYFPSGLIGAVSAGGKYVAVGGLDGIAVVSLAEQREVGTLPVTLGEHKHQTEYQGMAFSPDGEKLLAILNSGTNQIKFRSWSATTGKELREQSLAFRTYGQIIPDPELDALIVTGAPSTGWGPGFWQHVSDRETGARLLEAKTGRILASHQTIVRWSDQGAVLAVGPLLEEAANGQPEQVLPGVGLPRIYLYATETVQTAFRDAANLTDFGMAKRPEPTEPDRSLVKSLVPEPPVAWQAPPTFERPEPPSEVSAA